jgi:hypothetical protein
MARRLTLIRPRQREFRELASSALSRPFRPRAWMGMVDPGHRPGAEALGLGLPARWAGFCETLLERSPLEQEPLTCPLM